MQRLIVMGALLRVVSSIGISITLLHVGCLVTFRKCQELMYRWRILAVFVLIYGSALKKKSQLQYGIWKKDIQKCGMYVHPDACTILKASAFKSFLMWNIFDWLNCRFETDFRPEGNAIKFMVPPNPQRQDPLKLVIQASWTLIHVAPRAHHGGFS